MKVRSAEGMMRRPCPFCGRAVLCDDAALTVHHEAPVCDGFTGKMVALGLRPIAVEPTLFVRGGREPS